MAGADVLSSVMGTLRRRGAAYCYSVLGAPWGIRFLGRPYPVIHALDSGACWLRGVGPEPVRLTAGDVVLVPDGREHALSDAPEREAKIVDFDGSKVHRSWARAGGAAVRTGLICAQLDIADAPLFPLLSRLPPLVRARRDGDQTPAWLLAAITLLTTEANVGAPGADAVIERLVDVLFVHCLRACLDDPLVERAAPGWLHALRDPRVAAALALLHAEPARAWSVAELARRAGMSRSTLFTRFTATVGEPPLTYLTRWRLHQAAQALRERPGAPIKEIAAAVGYESEATFHRAFRRLHGVSPGAYRATAY